MSVELFKRIEPCFMEAVTTALTEPERAKYKKIPAASVEIAVRAGYWACLVDAGRVAPRDLPADLAETPFGTIPFMEVPSPLASLALVGFAARQGCDPEDDADETITDRVSRYVRDIILKAPETVATYSKGQWFESIISSERKFISEARDEAEKEAQGLEMLIGAMKEHGVTTVRELIDLGVIEFEGEAA